MHFITSLIFFFFADDTCLFFKHKIWNFELCIISNRCKTEVIPQYWQIKFYWRFINMKDLSLIWIYSLTIRNYQTFMFNQIVGALIDKNSSSKQAWALQPHEKIQEGKGRGRGWEPAAQLSKWIVRVNCLTRRFLALQTPQIVRNSTSWAF